LNIISLLGRAPTQAQVVFEGLLQGQCWARFAGDYDPHTAGPTPSEANILAVISPVLTRCEQMLPRPGELSVVLLPQGQDDWLSRFAREQMFGVSGLTAGATLIALRVGLEIGWQVALADAVAHEYHHAAWIALQPEIDRSVDLPLAEHLAFEGRACVFARLMTGGWVAPWTRPLEDSQFAQRVKQAVRSGQPFVQAETPDWWVYRLGTEWIQAALRLQPDLSVAQWTRLSAQELFNFPVH
jgi:Predicted Zn-dependent protease (DUF2268)